MVARNSRQTNTNLAAALEYAHRGWQVFPLHTVAQKKCTCRKRAACGSIGKHPLTQDGLDNATTDEAIIHSWWRDKPGANVAIRTGPESKLWVLDLDGADGIRAWGDLEREHEPAPTPLTVTTGGGGAHLYFAWPGEGTVGNPQRCGGKSIDARGNRGYVVAPPSAHHSGRSYQWANWSDDPPAAAPAWLLAWVRQKGGKTGGKKGGKKGGSNGQTKDPFRQRAKGDDVEQRAILYLDKCDPAVSGAGGHGQTLSVARAIVWGFDLGPERGFQLLWHHYNPRCQPPWSEKELRHKCEEADTVPFDKPRGWLLNAKKGGTTSGPGAPDAPDAAAQSSSSAKAKPSAAAMLLGVAGQADYCHDDEGRAYAVFTVDARGGKHRETWPVRSKGFRGWLQREFYRATKRGPTANAMEEVLGVLEARGRYDGLQRQVFVRVGRCDGNIILDLADEAWRSVVVTPQGWAVVQDPPVLFRRPRGLLALPEPQRGGDLVALRRYLNVQDDHWPLIVGWLVASLFPEGPYPVCCMLGEQGTAKSTNARVLRSLIDPSKAPLRGIPRDERDLIISASNSWVLALDNLSNLSDRRNEWMSDALCRVATSSGFATRLLFTDTEEEIFDVVRPIILTGIEDLAAKPDLIDRSLNFHLPVIPEGQRQTESVFWERYTRDHPSIFGGLLDVLRDALRELPNVQIRDLPRMADFAVRGVAACRAIGRTDAEFLDAYRGNQDEALSVSLDAAVIKKPLWDCFKERISPWCVTWADLLVALASKADDATRSSGAWPKDTRRLSGLIRRLAPGMRRAGFLVDSNYRTPAGRDRGVMFTWDEKKTGAGHRPHRPERPEEGPATDAPDAPDDVVRDFSSATCPGDPWSDQGEAAEF